MQKLIIINLLLNVWIAGNTLESLIKTKFKSKFRMVRAVIWHQLLMVCIGFDLMLLFFVWKIIKDIWIWITITTQVKFWWRWHTGFYDKEPDADFMQYLDMRLQHYAAQKKTTWGEKHLIYCAYKLFKRYNYHGFSSNK